MKKLLFILLAGISLESNANCPAGMVTYDPNTGNCFVHDGRGGVTGYSTGLPASGSGDSSYSAPQTPTIIRIPDKWGAVSVNTSNNYMYSAVKLPSKQKAKKEAIRLCLNENGKNASCVVPLAYANGCAAVANGVKAGNIYNAYYDSAEGAAAAENAALAQCYKAGNESCKISMPAQCSLPD